MTRVARVDGSMVINFLVIVFWVAMAWLMATTFSSCSSASAAGVPRDGTPGLTVERYAVDSARVIARWAKSCDSKGCADNYTVRWSTTSVFRTNTVTGTADTARIPWPGFGDSVMVTATVTPNRRGKAGPAKTAAGWVVNTDAPPPAVDSLKVDTTAIPRWQSFDISFYSPSGAPLGQDSVDVKEKDSVMVVAKLVMRPGFTRRPTDTTWWTPQTGGTAVVKLVPFGPGFHADTAWMYALQCNCVESGSPTNPPRLNLGLGRYEVKKRGQWVPVTPVSATGF